MSLKNSVTVPSALAACDMLGRLASTEGRHGRDRRLDARRLAALGSHLHAERALGELAYVGRHEVAVHLEQHLRGGPAAELLVNPSRLEVNTRRRSPAGDCDLYHSPDRAAFRAAGIRTIYGMALVLEIRRIPLRRPNEEGCPCGPEFAPRFSRSRCWLRSASQCRRSRSERSRSSSSPRI